MKYSDYKKEIINLVTVKLQEYQQEKGITFEIDNSLLRFETSYFLKKNKHLTTLAIVQNVFRNYLISFYGA